MTDRVALLPAMTLEEAPADPLRAQFIEIAQKDSAQNKGAEAPKGAGDAIFNGALAVKPDEVGEGFRDAQAAARDFISRPDKSEALAKGAPAFEAAVKQSDDDYMSAIAKYSAGYLIKRHDVEGGQMNLVMGAQILQQALQAVPEEKQSEASHMVALAIDKETSPALKETLLKEMDQFPGLRKSCEAFGTAITAETEAVKAMEEAAKPLVRAAYEQAATRYIYAHAMELGGETGKSVLMKQEGQSKIDDAYFEYLDKPKPPKPMLKV